MKKIIIAALTVLTLGATQAEYTIKIPLEQNQGGSLPSGTISIKNITPQAPIENWMPTTPFYTEWVNDGEPFDCTNWSPDPSTVAIGETFTQTATDCEQDQTRNRQDREQETTTSAIRNSGSAIVEIQTLTNQPSERPATGTKPIIEPIIDCRFMIDPTPAHWWVVGREDDSIVWISSGTVQNTILPKNSTTFSAGGWTYTRGQFQFFDLDGNSYYEICRVPS
ncbi:hypothetical protein [Ectopseudomonas oleovorans]|uniref:hypothetical protein n=1 Tax=Ectopseudomonas oleovorans TaxID=301 RepID=UPI0010BF42C7|nr:hypothetical protein [Pseudomonas oleovorans]